MIKKNICIAVFIIILIEAVIGWILFKNRAFSHLAVWNVVEFDNLGSFYWPAENAPGYFKFEPASEKISIFANEIYPLIREKSNDLEIMLETAKYVAKIFSGANQRGGILRWGSPEEMLEQVRVKAFSAHCFHRSILFSAYLSGAGLKSRLWALENDKFDAPAHSVNEVYIGSLKKWVFVDVTFGFYALENEKPLSFLELRERLLRDAGKNILLQGIDGKTERGYVLPVFYPKLVKCVFLRSRNDFINKYNFRYGVLSAFQNYIDKLPSGLRIGANYLLDGQEKFIHYRDKFSKSLKPNIITAKIFFYIFILVLFFAGVFCLVSVFPKARSIMNLSKKDTLKR